MIYEWNNMRLNTIQVISLKESNRVYICQDIASAERNNYTVIDVYDHNLARDIIKAFYGKDMSLEDRPNIYDEYKGAILKCFSYESRIVLVFPHVKSRPLMDFHTSQPVTLAECERICNSFVLCCLTAQVPYSFLYLMLTQNQIHIAKDSTISLGYAVDISKFDSKKGEKECVVESAKVVLELLKPYAGDKKNKTFSYELIQKRVASVGYQRFTELYKDLTIAASSKQRGGFLARLSDYLTENKDRFFRILLVISLILLVITLLTFITQAFLGDIPWLRIFFAGFRRIGTESMIQ